MRGGCSAMRDAPMARGRGRVAMQGGGARRGEVRAAVAGHGGGTVCLVHGAAFPAAALVRPGGEAVPLAQNRPLASLRWSPRLRSMRCSRGSAACALRRPRQVMRSRRRSRTRLSRPPRTHACAQRGTHCRRRAQRGWAPAAPLMARLARAARPRRLQAAEQSGQRLRRRRARGRPRRIAREGSAAADRLLSRADRLLSSQAPHTSCGRRCA